MSIIEVECIDQILNLKNTPTIAAGDVNTDIIKFTYFCNEWNGFGKTAIFCRSDSPKRYKSAIIDGEAIIPHEVLQTEGFFYFGVHGVITEKDDDGKDYIKAAKTSQMIGYKVVKGAELDGSVESDPVEAEDYERIMAAYGEVMQLHPYIEDTDKEYNYTGE